MEKHKWGIDKRDSNIELFRIIVMFLIIAHHFVVNSGLSTATGPLYSNGLNWKTFFLLILGMWGKIGINCFVLITGYYMTLADISANKFCKLLFQVIFYNVLLFLLFSLTGYEPFFFRNLFYALIPVHYISSNFTACFLFYYLLIPFVNKLLVSLDERLHLRLIALSLFIYTVFYTLRPIFLVSYNYITWFLILHFVAAYIKLYPKKIFVNFYFWRNLLLNCLLFDVISVIVCFLIGMHIHRSVAYHFVADSNTLLAFLTGLAAFMFFKQLQVQNRFWINLIASTTFGVFIIHANSDTMRLWLWRDTIDVVGHYNSPFFIAYAIVCVLLIFLICSIIDLLRKRFVEPKYMRLCSVMIDSVSKIKLLNNYYNNKDSLE